MVDYVDNKTWILTSATLVRKPDTQFEAYKPEEIKVNATSALLLVPLCCLCPPAVDK